MLKALDPAGSHGTGGCAPVINGSHCSAPRKPYPRRAEEEAPPSVDRQIEQEKRELSPGWWKRGVMGACPSSRPVFCGLKLGE